MGEITRRPAPPARAPRPPPLPLPPPRIIPTPGTPSSTRAQPKYSSPSPLATNPNPSAAPLSPPRLAAASPTPHRRWSLLRGKASPGRSRVRAGCRCCGGGSFACLLGLLAIWGRLGSPPPRARRLRGCSGRGGFQGFLGCTRGFESSELHVGALVLSPSQRLEACFGRGFEALL
jgi:hypothetical protein